MQNGEFKELKLSQVVPGNNYRKHYDKQKMKELTASIKAEGVLQPVVVRKKGKVYEIVIGERRRRGSVDAGKKTIPALVRDLTDVQVREIQAIENIQREDPNPMDEAIAFKDLLAIGKHTVETLAAKFSKGKAYVYTRLKLNELESSCQKALLAGEIDLSHASILLRVPDKAAQKEMLESILDQDMSPAQVRQMIVEDYGRDMARAVFAVDACGKCDHRSTTQEKLFEDIRSDGDRCMDEKCWKKKTHLALQALATDHKNNGRPVIIGAAAVQKLYAKGNILRNISNLKPKCKACTGFAFFYADDRPGTLDADYGWWCPKSACYNETVLGMKPPKKKEPADRSQEAGSEQPAPPDPSDTSAPSEKPEVSDLLDKVSVPGLTDPVTVECPCCFTDIRLLPQVKDVAEVVESAEVVS